MTSMKQAYASRPAISEQAENRVLHTRQLQEHPRNKKPDNLIRLTPGVPIQETARRVSRLTKT